MKRWKQFYVDERVFREMEEAMLATPDVETCGVLIGDKNEETGLLRARRFQQITNISDYRKEIDYLMDPQELMGTLKDTTFIDKKSKNDWVCIWHTHPSGVPIPSSIDVERAEYNVIYIIGGLKKEQNKYWDWSRDLLCKAYGYDKEKNLFYEVKTEVI